MTHLIPPFIKNRPFLIPKSRMIGPIAEEWTPWLIRPPFQSLYLVGVETTIGYCHRQPNTKSRTVSPSNVGLASMFLMVVQDLVLLRGLIIHTLTSALLAINQ